MAETRNNKGISTKSGNKPGNTAEKLPESGLEAIAAAARHAGGRKLPPVHLWNPSHCGDIGLRIARDGTWFYQNSPIGRMPLVKLFASVLRKDTDEHVLVTPVEKITVEVEDAPFLAVEMIRSDGDSGQILSFRTNVDDWIEAGRDNEIRFEPGPSGGVKPYIRVRADLWALVSRALFYDIVELGETRDVEGREMFGIASNGAFFIIADGNDPGEGADDGLDLDSANK